MSKNDRLVVYVPLGQIRISERRRRAINASTVEQYRQWLEQGREAPPVRLVRREDGFVVRDGRHRVLAAVAAGHVEINAEVPALLAALLAKLSATVSRLWKQAPVCITWG
jgi:ParB-like chromosome segregation protein Spo0J